VTNISGPGKKFWGQPDTASKSEVHTWGRHKPQTLKHAREGHALHPGLYLHLKGANTLLSTRAKQPGLTHSSTNVDRKAPLYGPSQGCRHIANSGSIVEHDK
jgi:hypothetical protein